MNRRTDTEIADFNKNVAKALGNSKEGKSMAELEEALAGADRTHIRRALQANGAACLGKTRSARWFSSVAVAKYGAEALTPQPGA